MHMHIYALIVGICMRCLMYKICREKFWFISFFDFSMYMCVWWYISDIAPEGDFRYKRRSLPAGCGPVAFFLKNKQPVGAIR